MKKGLSFLLTVLFALFSVGAASAQKTFDKSGRIARDFEKRRQAVDNETYF